MTRKQAIARILRYLGYAFIAGGIIVLVAWAMSDPIFDGMLGRR